ncbi:MAG: hypothetical protein D5R97_09115 [Candidatus Syntrophonatronum acetioxidans]|uniref:Uncharacterized protein n=1 Tax=Candidatus Syntrophonatronum acetioxidans TaxID=1795816 RepID=A0A424YB82_9FIRM|nr:MAG: hypothetical protein D5R97_09115 [Candidatus Syntrophonatronum acetioxidans]
MTIPKEEAKKILNNMPDSVTWDDIMYQFYVKRKISLSLKALEEDKTVSHDDAKKRLLDK